MTGWERQNAHFNKCIPKWELRNPLQTFPNPREFLDGDSPLDCIDSDGDVSCANANC